MAWNSMENNSFTNDDSEVAHITSRVHEVEQPMEISDIILKVEKLTNDVSTMFTHIVSKTKDTYLSQLIDTIVMDLTLIPIVRSLKGLQPTDTARSVSVGFTTISKILANAFHLPQQDIETKIMKVMEEYPVDDIRQSYAAREQNRLH